jgi:hypothetical protein
MKKPLLSAPQMTPDQDKPTTAHERDDAGKQCAECDTTLVEDQRYCLQCGARRGQPRIDFTAFWRPLSLTDGHNRAGRRNESEGATTTSNRFWLGTNSHSRRVAAALAAGVLAVGIVAGAALGPAPASSPADSSTLAQQAVAALVARASSGTQASPPTSASVSPTKSETTKTSVASVPAHKAKAKQPEASGEASAPPPSESSSSSEAPSGSPSSEGTSAEGTPSKGSSESEKTAAGTPIKLPPIKHVWLIALSNQSFASALAQSQTDPYLTKQLLPKGTLLSGYTLSASSALANGIALISGQGVNLNTEQNCPSFLELQPPTVSAANGLAEGVGCVYPQAVKTLPDGLTAAGLTWRAYVQGMESAQAASPTPSAGAPSPTPASAPAGVTCRHPEPGGADPNHAPAPGDPYLTFRNPFVYFHSLLDGGACASGDVDLSRLQGDLATPADTPSLSWIAPSACDDGSSAPCAPGAPAGLGPADSFLKTVVPQILATAAYRKEGLIAIVPDSAPSAAAGAAAKPVGALLISPFVHSGARVPGPLNDFSLLKSLTRLFGVLPLGHANDPSAVSFGASVYRTTK